jgi:pimeloyl-ACP methyl ester carboxylesterase
LTFERAKAEKKGGVERITEGMKYILSEDVRNTEKSINYFFPWLYNQEEVSLAFVSKNVAAKIEAAQSKESNEMSKKGYECVLVDLPNFGYSTRETADMEIVDRETLITELMKSIAPMNEWILAGHSMGGGVAMNIACLEPEINSLMLFCPCPIVAQEGIMADMMSSKVMGAMANFIFEKLTKITPLLRLVALMAFMDVEFTKDYDLSLFSAPLQIHNTGYSNMITSAKAMGNNFDEISKLTMPVLLVQADKDLIINASMKSQVAEAFPNAETYTVAGGGHLCIENHDEELAELIDGFIK